MMPGIGWALGLVCAYLIGSIPFGYLIGRLGGLDIRQWGSRNVGATNVARILGYQRGIVVLVLDALKGAAVVGLVARSFAGPFDIPDRALYLVFCAAAVIVGHTFTCWLQFKGGKGVATALGAWLVLAWLPTLIALAVWVAAVLVWRYISLASIVASASLPVALGVLRWGEWRSSEPELVFAGLLAVLVIARHVGNVARILNGTESKINQLFVKQIRAPRPKGTEPPRPSA